MTHNENFNYIIKYYDSLNLDINDMRITENIIYIDNCGNQYKCKENFIHVAKYNTSTNKQLTITHRFAQK